MKKAAFCWLFLTVTLVGLGFRFSRLDIRPVHHDEANQAVKFGTLLESGEYRYDPNEHHGPTLYYLTLVSAWSRGQKTMADLDEKTLRAVPAAFGLGLIALFLLLARGLGRVAVVLSALFAALSPSLTYYSRFYMQESLFAFFALGFLIALGRYALQPAMRWALAAGVGAGLAYATKETSIIVFAAAGVALFVSWFTIRREKKKIRLAREQTIRPTLHIMHLAAGLAAAVLVAVLFYSSFFRNPAGILDSVHAFRNYAVRGSETGIHTHPWYYYLNLLAFSSSGGLLWTEGYLLVLALVGACSAFWKKPQYWYLDKDDYARNAQLAERFWTRYWLMYSIATGAIFSAIAYKTPWNLLPLNIGLILLAGTGGAALFKTRATRHHLAMVLVALLAAACHLGVQNWTANYVLPADWRNPYVYAQTSPDFLRLAKRVLDLSAVHSDGRDMLVKVVAGPYEQWPIPWYLRGLRRVGYWTDPSSADGFDGVPVVIASQENAALLDSILGDRYQAEFYGLRPGVLLTVYIDRPLWQTFLERRAR